jgi:surface carbohydrate biosynthesis protein
MFFNFIKFIFTCKKEWKKPKEAKIIIYDSAHSETLIKYFNKKDVAIYYNRFETNSIINMYVLIISIFSFPFGYNYKRIFFLLVKPKYIFTLNDNNISFYKLKLLFPNIKTICIQASWKNSSQLDIFGSNYFISKEISKEKLECDFFFCYNENVGRYLQKRIKCKYIVIGSFLSNDYIKKKLKKHLELTLISQYRKISDNSFYSGQITYYDFRYNENIFFERLNLLLKKKKKKIIILGSKSVSKNEERKFYKNIFKNNLLRFIPQNINRKTYKFLDQSRLAITLDSTLGYENLLRNNKTLFFSIRQFKKPELNYLRFGWPKRISNNKYSFLTYNPSIEEIERLIFPSKISNANYKKFNPNDIGIYDGGNKIFKNFLSKIII